MRYRKINHASATADLAWAEMLSKMGTKMCRLDDLVELQSKRRRPAPGRAMVLHEIEKERARIARDLHAGAGQPLSGIKLNLEILHECAGDIPVRALEALERLNTLADQALQQVRAVSHRLHPPAWQELSVEEAIQSLISNGGLDQQYDIQLQAAELHQEPPHAVKIALYRCTQECLSNIVRHAGATAIRIVLSTDDTNVYLQVTDNGRGFQVKGDGSGIGMEALREHAAALGGTCRFESGKTGTTVLVSIPLNEEE